MSADARAQWGEPEGAREWVQSNANVMRVAYDTTDKPELIAWFAARDGAPRRDLMHAFTTIALAAIIETRLELRGVESTEESRAAESRALEPELSEALNLAGIWAYGKAESYDEQDRSACYAAGAACYRLSDELYERVKDDLAAGRITEMMDLPPERRGERRGHVWRLREVFAAQFIGDVAYATALAQDVVESDARRWMQIVERTMRTAPLAAGNDLCCRFLRDALPFDSLPSAHVWDAPAPGGRSWMDGQPWNDDPSRLHSWIGMALALGEKGILLAALKRAFHEIGEPEGIDLGEHLDALDAIRKIESPHRAEDAVNEALCPFVDEILEKAGVDTSELDEAFETASAEIYNGRILRIVRACLPSRIAEAIELAASWKRSPSPATESGEHAIEATPDDEAA